MSPIGALLRSLKDYIENPLLPVPEARPRPKPRMKTTRQSVKEGINA